MDDTSRGDNGLRPNGYAGKENRSSANPAAICDFDGPGNQVEGGLAMVMTARAEIGPL